jgi:DNA invertase Pin-like site-specific DNA recombinase
MNKTIAYIRISNEKQSCENQRHKILEFSHSSNIKIDKFVEIEISSTKSSKSRLIDDLFETMESGDTLITTELSRLGRNMLQILSLVEKFNAANIKLIFVNQPELSTNKNDALSSLLISIYGYFAQTEREIISSRTKQGLAAAKAKGRIGGRKKGQIAKSKFDPYREKIEELYQVGLSANKIVSYINVGTQQSLSNYISSRKISREKIS